MKYSLVNSSIKELLNFANIKSEPMISEGLQFLRKKYQGSPLYFISNQSQKRIDQFIPLLNTNGKAYLIAPMSGKKGRARMKEKSIYLQLKAGESCIVLLSNQKDFNSAPFPYFKELESQLINSEWNISFTKGGPIKPADTTVSQLISWTVLDDKMGEFFSGTATYTTQLQKPIDEAAFYRLDLGSIAESARVYINDTAIDTLIGPSYHVDFPSGILKDKNELKVEVSNLMLNRIRYMDLKGIEYRKFYNINFPSKTSQNSQNGLFHADHLEPSISGLLGPVNIIPLVEN